MNRLDKPSGDALATPADGMDQPIDVPMCATLGLFMMRNPQCKLFAIDKTGQLCELRIDERQTLQAKVGKDWLIVQSYEKRFRLTAYSLAYFRQIKLQEDMDKCPATQGVPARLSSSVSASVARATEKNESDVLLRSEFGQRLLYCFQHFALSSVRDGHYFMIDGGLAMYEMMESAEGCSFELEEICSPSSAEGAAKEKRPKIRATWGPRISILLKRILADTGNWRCINQLRANDKFRIGPFCICFNPDRRKIYIINKEVFMGC